MSSSENPHPRIIVKKKGGHGHHGGAWKVAYADFITAMMALFLLLWLVGQKKEVKKAVAEYFRDPGVFDSSRSGIMPGDKGIGEPSPAQSTHDLSPLSSGDMAMLKETGKHLKETFSRMKEFENIRNQIRINVTNEGLEIQIVERVNEVLFEIGSAQPKPDTRRVLMEIGKELGTLPNSVVIGGHTDRRPYSTTEGYTNWELSADRANSARRVLSANGMRTDQVARVIGNADRELIDPANPYADTNRRISILVLARNPAQPSAAAASEGVQKKDTPSTTVKVSKVEPLVHK